MHEDAGANQNLDSIAFDHRLQLPALLPAHFSTFVLQLFLSQLHASKTKAESCSRCVALDKH